MDSLNISSVLPLEKHLIVDEINNISYISSNENTVITNNEKMFHEFTIQSNWSIDGENIKRNYRIMQDVIIKRERSILINLLERTEFEMGYESEAERYFNKLAEDYGITADSILQNIYLDYMYSDSHILKHLLFIVAELPKNRRDNSVMIALAGLSNPNIEIQDLSVRCFECWNEKKFLPSLHKTRSDTSIDWLRQYIDGVISEIKLNGE